MGTRRPGVTRRFRGWRPTTRIGRNAVLSIGLISVSPVLGFLAAVAAVDGLHIASSHGGDYPLLAVPLTTAFAAGAHWVALLLGERSELVLMLAVALTAAAVVTFVYIAAPRMEPVAAGTSATCYRSVALCVPPALPSVP
jgi:hypothetical protein